MSIHHRLESCLQYLLTDSLFYHVWQGFAWANFTAALVRFYLWWLLFLDSLSFYLPPNLCHQTRDDHPNHSPFLPRDPPPPYPFKHWPPLQPETSGPTPPAPPSPLRTFFTLWPSWPAQFFEPLSLWKCQTVKEWGYKSNCQLIYSGFLKLYFHWLLISEPCRNLLPVL